MISDIIVDGFKLSEDTLLQSAFDKCTYCGMFHAGICYRIKEIEYHTDGRTIKRIVFFEQNKEG